MMTNFNEPNAVQEIYKIRLENYEKTKGKTAEERNQMLHDSTKEIIAEFGFKILPSANPGKELEEM